MSTGYETDKIYTGFFFNFMILLIIFIFIYSSTIFIPFLHHDSYRYISNPMAQVEWLVKIGRPLTSLLERFQGLHINNFSDVAIFRILSIVCLSITGSIVAMLFNKRLHNRYLSIAVSVAIFTLPGFAYYIIMMFSSGILAVLLVVLSYICFHSANSRPHKHGYWRALSNLLLSLIFLYASMLLYPVTTFLFLLITLSEIFMTPPDKNSDAIRLFLRDTLFLSANAVFLFLIFKLLSVGGPGNYSCNISDISAILTRFRYLLTSDYKTASNLWNIYPAGGISISVSILAGIYFSLFLNKNLTEQSVPVKQRLRSVFMKSLLVGLLFCMVNYHLLLFQVPMVYRLYLNYNIFILLSIIIGAICFMRKYHKYIIYMTALTGSLLACYNTSQVAHNSVLEFNYVCSQIKAQYTDEIEQIHIILAEDKRVGFNGLPSRGDGFNCNTTAMFPIDEFEFLSDACIYAGIDSRRLNYTFSDYGEIFHINSKRTILIDMNNLYFQGFDNTKRVAMQKPPEFPMYFRFNKTGKSYMAVVGSSIFPFWENTDYRLPLISMIRFNQPEAVVSYELSAGDYDYADGAGRMPQDWEFEGSDDGATWNLLDKRSYEKWRVNKHRIFEINEVRAYRYYRICIIKGHNPDIIRLSGFKFNTR